MDHNYDSETDHFWIAEESQKCENEQALSLDLQRDAHEEIEATYPENAGEQMAEEDDETAHDTIQSQVHETETSQVQGETVSEPEEL